MGDLLLKQVKSPNGSSKKQRDTLRTLGLGKIGREATRPDEPNVRGAIQSVSHLLEVRDA